MPIPTPRLYEKYQDFINRFMSDPRMIAEFPNEKQRYAVAIDSWNDQ